MVPYPPVDQLPPAIETRNWIWKPFEPPGISGRDCFEGVDESGNAWLTKMSGSFHGYRLEPTSQNLLRAPSGALIFDATARRARNKAHPFDLRVTTSVL